MPIFARRRLQSMLHELSPYLNAEKGRDLVGRLEDKRVEQVLPAEMELALLWGLSRLGELEIEPEWWGNSRRPDAYSEALVPGVPVATEIAAHNDGAISSEAAMDRIARQISQRADRVRKGCGDRLYFSFGSESGYDKHTYYRRVLAPEDYEPSEWIVAHFNEWVRSGRCEREPVRYVDRGLDVTVELKAHKQTRFHNIWSSMPPETHSLDENPLHSLLKRKADQLRAATNGVSRYIFIADVGSTLLRDIGRIGEIDHTRRRVSGREIISHFVQKNAASIDAVIVFAPRREHAQFGRDKLVWSVNYFDRPGLNHDRSGLDRLVEMLPKPRYEGYQARSLFRQGVYSPKARGSYLGGSYIFSRDGFMHAKIPARAVLDLLAGRITPKLFEHAIGKRPDENNIFSHWLNMGMTLKAAQIEPGGIDEDDDHLVLTFADDPSARSFRLAEGNQ